MRSHWGYSIRNYFASQATDTYIVPPLYTVVGAVGMASSARKGCHAENSTDSSRAKEFVSHVKYAAFSFDYKPIKFTTMIRFSTSIYWLTTKDIEDITKGKSIPGLFKPIQFGLNSYFNGIIRMLILTDLDKADLYSIIRLGSKESIVSVKSVEEVKSFKKERNKRITNVTFSFNKDLIKSVVGSFYVDIIPSFSESLSEIYYSYRLPQTPKDINTEVVLVPNPVVTVEPLNEVCVFETSFGRAIGPGEICG